MVEEKRSLIEVQVREELYGTANQPVCIGKKDEQGNWLFPVKGALDPNDVAICIGERLLRVAPNDELAANVARLKSAQRALAETTDVALRIPYFCSGCPHNTSTRVPEGSRAYAGIGCHFMAQWMDRKTLGFTQMGGEGANWIGEAPFSKTPHVFQNLGDGTYNHSGYLAIRAAIDSGTTMTYKILFNDAVAMTGGQANEGGLTVPQIARQVAAEGASRVVVVTDEPDKYPKDTEWPRGLTIHHRDDLDAVQRELATVPGVTVLIYDQTCAAEKRRRRKRGTFPDPDKRVFINDLVCEGCGDCGVKSNCVSMQPLETELGRKRTIDQSCCNKDYSCVNGFCPSFVTVHGAKLKKGEGVSEPADWPELPKPAAPLTNHPYDIIVTGVGGTGIITVGAVLAMAAHLDGKGAGGDRHGRPRAEGRRGLQPPPHRQNARGHQRHPRRRRRGRPGARRRHRGGRQQEGAGRHQAGRHPRHRQYRRIPARRFHPRRRFLAADRAPQARHHRSRRPRAQPLRRCRRLATALLGNSIGSNMFMLGYAYQLGALPVTAEAIESAIEMNGQAVAMNLAAFRFGRRAVVDPAAIDALVGPRPEEQYNSLKLSQSFAETVERREEFLTAYQSKRYARRYRKWVDKVSAAEAAKAPGQGGLAEAVARYLFKLMAYKDEYEVARLYTDTSFLERVKSSFDGNLRLEFHLAPPLLAKIDPATGEPKKKSYGPWMLKAFGVLKKFKFLRGTPLDVFGYNADRRTERQLIADYEALLETMMAELTPANHHVAVALASIPEKIRGYGPVKQRHLDAAKAEEAALREQLRTAAEPFLKAAE